MIKEYANNVNSALNMLMEITNLEMLMDASGSEERRIMKRTIESLTNKIRIVNNSLPTLIRLMTVAQMLPGAEPKKTLFETVKAKVNNKTIEVTLDRKYRKKFLNELRITEENMKKIGRRKILPAARNEEYGGSRGYLKISNKFCMPLSRTLTGKGYFNSLSRDLKQANMDFLMDGYFSMMLFTSILAFVLGLFFVLGATFISYSTDSGFYAYQGNYLARAAKFILIPFILGMGVFLLMYLYPKTEKRDIEKKVNQELPSAVVYMSAVAGSGIEPSAIFKIIELSSEYPYLRKEIRKVLNQINIYGYDLVTALTNVAKNSPSQKLAELFLGLATTITSGGGMNEFFQKRAESLINEYRLEREKFTKLAETSMDLYITVVIAAPMILLLIFVLLAVSDFAVSLSPTYLTFLIIGMIAIINVVFMAIIHFKQPQY